MSKSPHPYFNAILDELAPLAQVIPRSMFGHQGYAIGTSVFAFLDEQALVVKLGSCRLTRHEGSKTGTS
jgi:hypothetical protein